ncbi:polysaccharide pyruvyl transferase family protein [Gordonia alkanivorans]|uniref:polysaccharide pyruvyl transferase family protein n=1 Tax=Gordonia alkanivorans TaxID=84096 RepID=UPI002447AA75|nr:polysaccharide pyruvyl transferase family protein [Gordonia alkanivorans]MDH3017410.1 polysaccharide pyruvyl transferase family protein [Gordonia alkanivorans]MDH3042730.1 polysaccharide pyruvyl transferase family protein [Gordonia alkanivorans]
MALVDFPAHQNAGDTLIYLGEMQYLREMGISVDYVCDFARYSAELLRMRVPDGPILLHGGGNFGDAWENFEMLRHRVISDFPDRKIIMLPQSIYYESSAKLEESKKILGSHPDLTIMVRERRSLELANRHFGSLNKVIYCPDMAFGIGVQAVPKWNRQSVELVKLMRQDRERVERPDVVTAHMSIVTDWGLTGLWGAAWKIARLPGRLYSVLPAGHSRIQPAVEWGYRCQAALNLYDARRKLGRGRAVLTDRLHASVLAALMGLPVVALDNNYGKIRDVYDDYLHTASSVCYASGVEEAQEQLEVVL